MHRRNTFQHGTVEKSQASFETVGTLTLFSDLFRICEIKFTWFSLRSYELVVGKSCFSESLTLITVIDSAERVVKFTDEKRNMRLLRARGSLSKAEMPEEAKHLLILAQGSLSLHHIY